jgi:hypothetical protein
VLVIGSRMFPLWTTLIFSGPVHTLNQEITPEMVAAVQHDYQLQNDEKRHSLAAAHLAAHRHSFGRKHSEARASVAVEQ